MVVDYSQRRAVSKNRPKKQPVGFLIPIVVVAVAVSFAGGMFTGWVLFRKAAPIQSSAVQPSPSSVQETAKHPAADVPTHQQPLTFYETLSKGNSNSLIGSGLNPKMPAVAVIHKPDTSSTPASGLPVTVVEKPPVPQAVHSQDKSQVPTAPPAPSPAKEVVRPPTTGKTAEVKTPVKQNGTFTVQVGSYKDRKEAEQMLARTKGAGLPAYIVEARTPDKGTWYRVRIGKKLDEQAANQLTSKAGKGAITVPE